MAQITPATGTRRLPDSERYYRLCPAEPLPTLDLSISIESRFLSRSALHRMRLFVRKSKQIGLVSCIALASYFVSMLAPVEIGRGFAIVAFVLWAPATVASAALLRYDVACLLFRTYDFWFCTFVNASTYITLGVILGDMRAAALVAAWSGIQMNILIDANIRAVKVWAILNTIGILNSTATWVMVTLTLIDDFHDATLLRVNSLNLLASAYVSSGLLTVEALVARNVFRKRGVFQKRANRAVIECTSYRVNLVLAPCRPKQPPMLHSHAAANVPPATTPEYMKTMQYVEQVGQIDAQQTVLQVSWVRSTVATASSSGLSVSVARLGAFALATSTLAALFGMIQDDRLAGYTPVCRGFALSSTALYSSTVAFHYQRKLLRALWTSFNFLFLFTQLTFAHLCVCDFFRWSSNCYSMALISWLWSHWILSLDALPPVMKRKLGLRKSFVVVVLVVIVCSGIRLVYQLLVVEIYDRVIWKKQTLGMAVQLRLVPMFYSCFCTVFSLLLRLLWRASVNPSDVLFVLDGAVVYENYLRTAKNRLSRRWGSFDTPNDQRSHQRGHQVQRTGPTRWFS